MRKISEKEFFEFFDNYARVGGFPYELLHRYSIYLSQGNWVVPQQFIAVDGLEDAFRWYAERTLKITQYKNARKAVEKKYKAGKIDKKTLRENVRKIRGLIAEEKNLRNIYKKDIRNTLDIYLENYEHIGAESVFALHSLDMRLRKDPNYVPEGAKKRKRDKQGILI